MHLGEKKEWLDKHGRFVKLWFVNHAWKPRMGGRPLESFENNYIEDLYSKAKNFLYERVNEIEHDRDNKR